MVIRHRLSFMAALPCALLSSSRAALRNRRAARSLAGPTQQIELICSLKRIRISALVGSPFPFLARREVAQEGGACCVLGVLVKRVTDLARFVVVRQTCLDLLSHSAQLCMRMAAVTAQGRVGAR